jgi:asparagine synthase (glutamine-hydrolysing)
MYGEPFNWGMHTYKLSPIAARGIRTVFSGAGADGTDLSKRLVAADRFNAMPGPVRSTVRLAVRGLRPLGLSFQQKAEWVTRRVDSLGDLYSKDSELGRLRRAALYRDPAVAEAGGRLLRAIFDEAASQLPDDDHKSALVVMDKRFPAAEAGSVWNRVFTRGNGLQGRFPFVDHAYIDLGMGAVGASAKDLMRHLAKQYLPESVVTAPKQPQEMPVGEWIRGPLADRVRERLADLPVGMAEIFDPAGVRAAIDRHIAGSEERGWQIISLLTLESWFRRQAS